MANVITQVEMMKFMGMDKAVFQAGTIVTPAAKDWAKEQNIQIIIGDASSAPAVGDSAKAEFLKQTVKAVAGQTEKAGGLLKKDELVKAVTTCLERLGCKVEN